ncbi:hypothetical protein [Nodularia spumigena]|jgi:hypothetical protein|uniref:hypothetical protein n=1 Tax=Nodularia spumigena TaxID=70799 RepID=UPI0000EAB5C2|nr:hypothetical protein [Nodularia spumigena]EAW44328.1 hypothetical protein N9414_09286 [Nodularia spumigena CCY9414]MEA5612992.1 hypothetical protein [Nodularia spumigena UHCC 0040]
MFYIAEVSNDDFAIISYLQILRCDRHEDGQDAHPTRHSVNLNMQNRCVLAENQPKTIL